ncbi:hypothetical protein PC116_g23999 [Phytophthora cactorum]|uniref:Uncharacterized protein n=1 Tax=Phytophthora cactorum TaxID=29920 RepID=A0A8T1ATC4_9STRA|nr:hypothetical protein PC115_g19710 [Phytophthora cactorum]KAG2979503.1 hypothetical protein PC119_g21466 [Phytophthora cactorum]KAG3065032.1 hypothetical protein PC122_g18306 [Phytophthora cactorum]KAG3159085.1 hypothetical protein PC128_g21362 [Phytophthora cactorum]KAG4227622.1 hypothetical protein PC116_g23999 [Phytophthora cactorum]
MDDNAKSKTDDPPTEEEDDAVNGGPQTTQCAPGFYRGGSPTSGATEQNPVNHEEFTVGFVAKEKTNAEDSDPGPASVFPYSTASHSSDIRPDQLTQPTPQQILEDSQALTVSKDPDPGVEYVKTVGSRYAWLRWIVMSNLPLSFCESELTRQYTSLPAVAVDTLRVNLEIKRFLEPHEEDLENVQVLMRKLRTVKEAAKLRAKTPLLPVLRQETWWSSTFATVDRYVRLREFLSADDGEIADLLLPRSTHRSLQTLLEEMKDIESISKKLQSDGLTLLLARELFGGLLELKPSFASYLASNAEIVDSPAFDSGAVKVFDKKAEMLTREERAALLPFKRSREDAAAQPARVQKDGLADRILKRRKVVVQQVYVLLAAIPPASNMVERLLSSARSVLRHERHRLTPMTLEMLLFLKLTFQTLFLSGW